MSNLNWTVDANCNGIDTDMFFPPYKSKIYPEERLLRQTCNNCSVFEDCREYALKHNVQGWWANTTESHRIKERRLKNIIPISIVKETD